MSPRSLLVLVALTLFVGCHDLSGIQSESCEHHGCPVGQTCACTRPIGCLCYTNGYVPDGFSAPDMTRSDLKPATDMLDPYKWNPAQPAGPAPGCASNSGWRLTDKLYACPGAINSPDFSQPGKQCAIGWSIPTTLTIPESACASVPWGFFDSMAHGISKMSTPDPTMRCDWAAPDGTWNKVYRWGCGPAGRVWNAVSGPHVYSFTAPVKCSGFPTVVACTGGPMGFQTGETPWFCDPPAVPYMESYFPKQSALGSMVDGVLCAQP